VAQTPTAQTRPDHTSVTVIRGTSDCLAQYSDVSVSIKVTCKGPLQGAAKNIQTTVAIYQKRCNILPRDIPLLFARLYTVM